MLRLSLRPLVTMIVVAERGKEGAKGIRWLEW